MSNATATYSDLTLTLAGNGAPSPATLGTDTVTLSGAAFTATVPATLLVAGYNLGLLTVGSNVIPGQVWVSIQATNTAEGSHSFNVPYSTTTVISDPDGIPGGAGPGGADESATALSLTLPLATTTWTPTGGNIQFRQGGSLPTIPAGVVAASATTPSGSIFITAQVAGGLIKANFDCSSGTTIISPPGGTSGTSFTPATAGPFENVSVVAPATAPVCGNETSSVGVGQSISIDLTNNCTDVNEGQGGGSPFTFNVGAPSAGTLTPTGTNGVYTYNAPASDPGAPVTISFTATDASPGLTSAAATITITILANTCDATTASCTLQEIIVQPVIGTTMTMEKVPGVVVMSTVILNGHEQVSTGSIQTITVTNARGTAAPWSVTGYATDLGAAGSPSFSPLPGATVPLCSNAGAGPFVGTPAIPAPIASNRLCIPGDNLGWTPAAVVAHNDIPGDVAKVDAGPSSAASPAAWMAALVAAGNVNDPGVGVDGLGGLLSAKTLCSAPVNQSGGTFTCNASLYLGVPASAAAGTFTGGLVLTLS